MNTKQTQVQSKHSSFFTVICTIFLPKATGFWAHNSSTERQNIPSVKIIFRAMMHSNGRGTKLVICWVVFLDLGNCKYNFTSAPPFLSSSSEVPSIKARNLYFPPGPLTGQQRAVFALGCECIELNAKRRSERTYELIRTVPHQVKNLIPWSECSYLNTLRHITLLV